MTEPQAGQWVPAKAAPPEGSRVRARWPSADGSMGYREGSVKLSSRRSAVVAFDGAGEIEMSVAEARRWLEVWTGAEDAEMARRAAERRRVEMERPSFGGGGGGG